MVGFLTVNPNENITKIVSGKHWKQFIAYYLPATILYCETFLQIFCYEEKFLDIFLQNNQ